MAIKAIINNTEKEIEQIKNSDAQDVDYVYSRIGDTEVEGESPISIKSIGGNLADYRIYGNTVDGESVGDRTANLFANGWKKGYIRADDGREAQIDGFICSGFFPVEYGQTYSISRNINVGYDNVRGYRDDGSFIGAGTDICDVGNPFPSAATNIGVFTVTNENVAFIRFNDSANDLGMKYMIVKGTYTKQTMPDYEPYGYKVPVTVGGKNLCNNIWEQKAINADSGSAIPNENIVCCDFIPVKPDVTYSCSRTIANNFINLRCYGANKNYLGTGATLANKGNPLAHGDLFGTLMITDARVSYIRFNDYSNALDTKYMLVEGVYTAETMPPYEPYHAPVTTPIYLPEQIRKVGDEAEYIDYGEQKQHRVRKNLLPNTVTSQTIDGVTFTVNEDGSVTCDGTASKAIYFSFATSLESGTYIISGTPRGMTENNAVIFINANYSTIGLSNNAIDNDGNGKQFVVTQSGTATLTITIKSGYTCNNLTFYPMIRKADISDDTYEPYIVNTEVNTNLPTLSTIKGTNTFSVNTSIQPPLMYIKDNFDYKKVFTATRTIEGESPLSYRSIEDSDSTLKNYRIYGQTSRNLFDFGEWSKNIKVNVDNSLAKGIDGITITANSKDAFTAPYAYVHEGVYKIYVKPNTNYLLSWVSNNNLPGRVFIFKNGAVDESHRINVNNAEKKYLLFDTDTNTEFVTLRFGVGNAGDSITYSKIMLIEGSTPLPYEPYGESVGDRTGNLFDYVTMSGTNGKRLMSDGSEISDVQWAITDYIPCDGLEFTINKIGGASPAICLYDDSKTFIAGKAYNTQSAQTKVSVTISSNTPAKYIRFSYFISNSYPTAIDNLTEIMLNEGSTALPYEPYGYNVPVTVSNGSDTLTTPIYLPEPIKMVGDEAEYIDYAEQKMHRVRKNLLPNTATSQTINGIRFTVNEDGSITCNGTATNITEFVVHLNFLLSAGNYRLTGCPSGGWPSYPGGKVSYCLRAWYSISGNVTWFFDYGDGCNFTLTDTKKMRSSIVIEKAQVVDNITFYPMIRKADIEDDTYEPYIENTEVDVTLPALPVLTGTNTLTVGTEVQPSDIYLKGKIKKKSKIYYKIYYYSQDGQTALSTETVEEGHDCTYSTVPTKESDTDFDYTFTGWSTTTNQSSPTSGATTNIQQDTNLYAAFSKSFKTDTISDSWKDIITACNNGTYSGKYQVGDLKTIDVGTEGPVQMQIVAIDTDLLASDNTKKAPITWISKQLLNTYKTMHRTPSNYLSDWANCDMRTYLRGTILPMLPSVVQNGIKEVTKYTCKRTSSTTWTTVSATENIWLPSYREVSNATSNCETSGVQYNSIFTDNASRVKSKAGNSAYYWWTRSASGNSNSVYWYCFASVDSNGSADYGGYYCTLPSGVAIGFCT